MNWFLKVLNKPYPYHIQFSGNTPLHIIFSLIVPLFLIVFQPFGIGSSTCEWLTAAILGMSIPIFFTLTLNFHGATRLFPQFFDEHQWSIGKEAAWLSWNFTTITIVTSIYLKKLPICGLSSINIVDQMSNAFLIGLIPAIICIYLNYYLDLKRKLKNVEKINSSLKSRVSYYEHGQLSLTGENSKERISLSTHNLVMIQSQDNYAKVMFSTSKKMDCQLIRSSLKQLEAQVNYPFIVRCHRSFIINLAKVEEVSGNARDFKIRLKNCSEWVPVSREAYRNITRLLLKYPPKTDAAVSFSSSL